MECVVPDYYCVPTTEKMENYLGEGAPYTLYNIKDTADQKTKISIIFLFSILRDYIKYIFIFLKSKTRTS